MSLQADVWDVRADIVAIQANIDNLEDCPAMLALLSARLKRKRRLLERLLYRISYKQAAHHG